MNTYLVLIRYGEKFWEVAAQVIQAVDPETAIKAVEDDMRVENHRRIIDRRYIDVEKMTTYMPPR